MNPKNNNQISQILRENFNTHIEAMHHFQDIQKVDCAYI